MPFKIVNTEEAEPKAVTIYNKKAELELPQIESKTAFQSLVRKIPNFPKPGINFVDISSITVERRLFKACIDLLADGIKAAGVGEYSIIGIDARGFIFASALAYKLEKELILARKPGKLPAETYSQEFSLEYGMDKLEINKCDIRSGAHYIIVDDIIATGGTAHAIEQIVTNHGGVVDMVLAPYLISACKEIADETIQADCYVIAEV